MSDSLNWHEIKTLADLPPDGKAYWCRMKKDGRIVTLVMRDGNWITWNRFQNPKIDPLALVEAWADYTYKTPKTPEERREYNRKQRQERKDRLEQEREAWIAAGKPKAKLLKRKKI